MEIKYNGSAIGEEGILTFSEVPNILQVSEDVTGTGSIGQLKLTCVDGWSSSVTADSQYYMTLFGETVSNVMTPSEAKNKKFYIYPNSAANTAMSMVKALRSCGSLAADYVITTSTTNSNGDSILMTAKTIGARNFTNNIDRSSIPNSAMTVVIINDGAEDTNNFFNCKIDVDVYEGDSYITTLEKNWYGNECAFDVTPVLSTLTEPTMNDEAIKEYTLKVSKLASDGSYTSLGETSGLTTYGYLANQSDNYKEIEVQILSNSKVNDRGGLLYVYGNTIPFSVLARAANSGGFTVTYTLYDSKMDVITTSLEMYNTPYGDAFIKDIEYTIPAQYYEMVYYVQIMKGNDASNALRFQVIKPLKAAENYQRILWRNEYGGISFFDFTSQRSESDSVDVETYEKNIFDYYNNYNTSSYIFEKKKVYSNKIGKTVKLKSHLLEEDGKYIFNSLIRSKKLWTKINGDWHYIIPKSLEVAEDGTYNGIYTATFTYEYSDLS